MLHNRSFGNCSSNDWMESTLQDMEREKHKKHAMITDAIRTLGDFSKLPADNPGVYISTREIEGMGEKLRVGVLASGSGTDLQSIIDASENQLIDAKVVVVLSDNAEAYALKRAKKHHIDAVFVDPKGLSRENHEKELTKILTKSKVNLVVGAGYMRLFSPTFVSTWFGKLINIHPALLPAFRGTNGQGDALDYGVKITGCTTHFIDHDVDHGPIILQAAVQVLPDDDRESLAKRILEVEHWILPRTIQLFAQHRLVIEGRKVRILSGESWIGKVEQLPHVLYPAEF
jgi:phosphoribosylglycinamide formyltransferase-1